MIDNNLRNGNVQLTDSIKKTYQIDTAGKSQLPVVRVMVKQSSSDKFSIIVFDIYGR